MRVGRFVRGFVSLLGLAAFAAPLTAQKPAPRPATIRVFFDCTAGGCNDFDFFRRQIPYVNWVRDRQDADVHVLITGQHTGGGGSQYQLAFIGLRAFHGHDETLVLNTPGTATSDELRRSMAHKVELGLVPYLVNTSAADKLHVAYGAPAASRKSGGPAGPSRSASHAPAMQDPWNHWVFSLNGSGYLQGETSQKTGSYGASVNAGRTTEAWKLSFRGSYNLEEDRYELTSGNVKETQRAWGFNSFAVRSVGSQWALGLRGDVGRSDYYNEDFKWSLRPGVEYDFFPYAQSSRRSLTLQYLVGPEHWKYHQGTIYEKTAETRTQESLTARLSLVQPWGEWSTSLTGAHYMSDLSQYHVSLNGYMKVRLFRGLSLRASAYYSWVHDQIYLSAGGATDEQTLLHLRQLYTTFSYFTSFGFSYQFGSIFNNVVNPRFGESGGRTIIFG